MGPTKFSFGQARWAPVCCTAGTVMSKGSPPFNTPEAEHLQQQEQVLAELTDQLTAREAELATIRAEFAEFASFYLRRFGPLYAELDRIEAELLGRPASETQVDSASLSGETGVAIADAASSQTKIKRLDELRDLFRIAAKMLHPDLAPSDEERTRRTSLMAELNRAYESGDEEAIVALLRTESSRPEAVLGDDVGSKLVRVLRQIQQVRLRLEAIDGELSALSSQPLFSLFQSGRAQWRAGQDPLAQDEDRLRDRISAARAQLGNSGFGPRMPSAS